MRANVSPMFISLGLAIIDVVPSELANVTFEASDSYHSLGLPWSLWSLWLSVWRNSAVCLFAFSLSYLATRFQRSFGSTNRETCEACPSDPRLAPRLVLLRATARA